MTVIKCDNCYNVIPENINKYVGNLQLRNKEGGFLLRL